MTRLFLVAGEPSGDLLGAALIAGLRELRGEALAIEGIGGPAMEVQGPIVTRAMRPPRHHAPTPEETAAHLALLAKLKAPIWLN